MPPADKDQAGDGRRHALGIDLSIEAGEWPPERVLSRLAATAFGAAIEE
jgi:hypothetical protein